MMPLWLARVVVIIAGSVMLPVELVIALTGWQWEEFWEVWDHLVAVWKGERQP